MTFCDLHVTIAAPHLHTCINSNDDPLILLSVLHVDRVSLALSLLLTAEKIQNTILSASDRDIGHLSARVKAKPTVFEVLEENYKYSHQQVNF